MRAVMPRIASKNSSPPCAPARPKRLVKHGDVRIDPYYWLRDRNNPETLKYLRAENAHTHARLRHTRGLQHALVKEMRAHMQEDDCSVPEAIGHFEYYTRTRRGKAYPIYCRRARTHTAAKKFGRVDVTEEIILDVNALAAQHRYCDVGSLRVSPDGALLAFTIDVHGDESYTLFVKDLHRGVVLRGRIEDIGEGIEWANDSRTIFYCTMDRTKRPYKIWRHELGTRDTHDRCLYTERDVTFSVQLDTTKDRQFILIECAHKESSETWLIDADRPLTPMRCALSRRAHIEYSVEHAHGWLYFLINDHGKNFRLVRKPLVSPPQREWEELVAHHSNIVLEEFETFATFVTLLCREQGVPRLRILTDRGRAHDVKFAEPIYTLALHSNPEFTATQVRFSYTSLVTPNTVIDYEPRTRQQHVRKRHNVPGYNPALYRTERVFARASDGTKIPISLVYRRTTARTPRPLVLYGYGAYGYVLEANFVADRLPLLDRGFVYAIAHVRGGGELGHAWYEAGKFLQKKNSFTDFVACADFLLAKRLTTQKKLVAIGRSAGGLLMGGVLNLAPERFACVIAGVAFVDALTTMLDPSIPLTTIEYDEWGNPNEPRYYRYIKSYSPYDNVRCTEYPHLLVTAGLNDPRVGYWECAKWVAKLRTMKTDTNRLCLHTELAAGHAGNTGRYARLTERALEYAFILDALGLNA